MQSTVRKQADGTDACRLFCIGPALLSWLTPSSNICIISPVDYKLNSLCKDLLVSLADMLLYSELKKSVGWSFVVVLSPPDTGRLLRCNLFGLLIDWIRPLLCQAYGEGEKTFGEVYDFVHRNNLPVCIFRLWTWASLNFGKLNLYLPPRLKNTHSQERMWAVTAEEDTFRFQDVIFKLFLCVSQGYV